MGVVISTVASPHMSGLKRSFPSHVRTRRGHQNVLLKGKKKPYSYHDANNKTYTQIKLSMSTQADINAQGKVQKATQAHDQED